MAAFRKVDSGIHKDEKYRSLDDLDKLLFLTILTHPRLLSFGAMILNMPGLVADMEPDPGSKKFRKIMASFNKLVGLGMVEYDPIGLIAVPNYLKYNPLPGGPKNEIWLQNNLDSLPKCELKNRVVSRCESSGSLPATSDTTSDTPSDTPSGRPSSPPCEARVERSIAEQRSCKYVISQKFANAKPRQGNALTPDSEEVQKVVKAVVAMWPTFDGERVKK